VAVKTEAPAKQGHDGADGHHAPAPIARGSLVSGRCWGVVLEAHGSGPCRNGFGLPRDADIVGLARHGFLLCPPDSFIETPIVPG
jgi:hypothetical protein